MEDAEKIKPYIARMQQELRALRPEVQRLAARPLDEQLAGLDARGRAALANRYGYALASLLFVHLKVLNVRDVERVMAELGRVKQYMERAKRLEGGPRAPAAPAAPERAAISRVHFQGTHTRFEDGRVTKRRTK
ncbi:ADR297Wp [Eremothecium gossypii ATCC 10895]|uniref:Exosome complex protein n=1 Tax=Eremothecium gossypii (strain ATCC 10895 / CBS 109.51 / FGSC 9923 / NRRL Y-1056) TaxID=284811 RepID=Q759I1_EREGS|nr:ADR297Wp [Eremothecium gossypii ATCC 10895]AAS52218.1 ADR297Wp [Eremothecium gossypii ATCC 10895]AEY96517.1 FADR297Wp [Eremothecium gossypii FDAG1]